MLEFMSGQKLEISNWNWTNQIWAKWHKSDTKSLPQFILLQIKGHYEVP